MSTISSPGSLGSYNVGSRNVDRFLELDVRAILSVSS